MISMLRGSVTRLAPGIVSAGSRAPVMQLQMFSAASCRQNDANANRKPGGLDGLDFLRQRMDSNTVSADQILSEALKSPVGESSKNARTTSSNGNGLSSTGNSGLSGSSYSPYAFGLNPPPPEKKKLSKVVDIQDDSILGGVSLSNIPRTGIMASRSVAVQGQFGLEAALRRLNQINGSNGIRRTAKLQMYNERPGKKKARLRLEKQQRRFDAEIRRLFGLVSEARRKGY